MNRANAEKEIMSKIRLLIVDDHQIVRAGLRMLFAAEKDMAIIGEVGSGAEALQAVAELRPDVVIMDVAMPGMSGIEATRRIKEVAPEVAVLALTMHEDEQYFLEMLNAGASGYIPKRAAPDDLVSAIHVVHQGNVFLHATLAKFLINELLHHAENKTGGDKEEENGDGLTPREREVLRAIAEGLTSREIAQRLVISPKTVDRHRENIMAKLNMHSRVDLVKYAIERGLLN
jgi:two-component system response regulator NreC